MITNERQYRISKGWLERFTEAHGAVGEQGGTLHPRAAQALRDQYASQIEELSAEIAEYEALRNGEIRVWELLSLRELPDALIQGRAVAGLSQQQLATKLGVKKQQVQRYEATRYAGVSLERIQAVAEALGLTIREQVTFSSTSGIPTPPPSR